MYFLDSDICINLLRGKLPETYKRLKRSNPKLFGIPAVVAAELRTGALKSDDPKGGLLLLETFLAPFQIIPFDENCAVSYSKIRTKLEIDGQPIGPNDLFIAATAVANNAVLVTGNTREFVRVEGLDIENWAEVDLDD